MAASLFPISAVLLLVLATSAAASCTSGVLQLNPASPDAPYDPCTGGGLADRNTIKAICGVAFKVTVKQGIIRLVPLEKGSYNYSGPGPLFPPPPLFDCKDHNASGLFAPRSTTAATVMLYDNYGGPLSNFTKTGPSQVSLSVGRTYNYRVPPFACTYKYTVISGCVLGARPASATPPPCPPGHISKTGRYGIKYCAACPKATYSPGGAGATTCTPCPIGTANFNRGAAKCRPCNSPGEYASKPGLDTCEYCSTYDNKWTDSLTKCEACPANSTPSPAKPNQCVRCYAGKKCCTVNWDKDCPQCTDNSIPQTYTSIFALESTTPRSCFATNYAVCAPKINITIDGTCTITINSMDNRKNPAPGVYCSWSNTMPIKGASANALTDMAQLGQYYAEGSSLLEGNLTAVASPYLEVTVPTASCKFRYRALTSPAATILGAAPRPATTGTCPAGRYIDTSTDTKPGPCLPCPPGTYSKKAGTTGACTRCPAGTYTKKYGSKRCTKCPANLVSKAGAASCGSCNQAFMYYPNPDGKTCTRCPSNTGNYFYGTGTCLGSMWGSTCCAAGACGTQVPCGPNLTPTTGDSQIFQSVFRLVSSSLSSSTCKNATFLACLRPGTQVVVNTYSYGPYVDLALTNPSATCAVNSSYTIPSCNGGIAATNRALVAAYEVALSDSVTYEILSNSAARTFTMYLSTTTGFVNSDLVTSVPAIRKECSATFELVNGFFLDIQPPASSSCPPNAASITIGGRTFCRYCGMGSRRSSTGSCQPCPKGTYQPRFAGTTCKACPAGYSCYEGSMSPQPCGLGQFGPKSRLPECRQCPAGHYSGYGANKKCTKCPAGTISPKSSSACGIPWLTKF